MKTNTAIFFWLGVFIVVVAGIYGLWSGFSELAGFLLLLLSGVLGFMMAFYLKTVAKKSDEMVGDNPRGLISDMAGDYGEFAPWSWWPLGLGASCAFVFMGLAIDWWVFFLALIPSGIFLTGWVMEYNRKRFAH